MIQLQNTQIDERTKPEDLERIRRNLVDAVTELQKQPLAFARVIKDVSLLDGIKTPIPHGLGRRATVFVAPQRGVTLVAIEEIREDSGPNPKVFVVLRASGGDIVTDVVVA